MRVASPARFELTTPGLGILCSILLSYGDSQAVGRRDVQTYGRDRRIVQRRLLGIFSGPRPPGSDPMHPPATTA